MNDYGYIERNYRELLDEVGSYERLYGRNITTVAVTKSGNDEELIALARAGVTDIGENRPTELKRRAELLEKNGYSPKLHEIGNLQRNKVKLVVGISSLIHSVGSYELACEIDKQAKNLGIVSDILIEVNSAEEEMKGGVLPEDAEKLFLRIRELENLRLCGLMTMGPVCENPEDARKYFKLTKEIFDRIKNTYGWCGDGVLSMGMSDSYRVAIEEGSTLIRVGRKLFDKTKGDI